ncbi:MAG: hypothetical protein CL584_00405 [Alteromonadaceae bacterium]|nr:hypothetical protein [Alteromonadaceae bacterium]|tara:strand:+ start:8912 stop:10816 length:1905 start_codon:yes stop_codon:yes gene_type:complete
MVVVIGIALIASGLWFYATVEPVDNPAIATDSASGQVAIDTSPQESALPASKTENTPEETFIPTANQCAQFRYDLNHTKSKFFEQADFTPYLDKGYSVDDITLAILSLDTPLSAAEWRDTYRKRFSPINQANKIYGGQIESANKGWFKKSPFMSDARTRWVLQKARAGEVPAGTLPDALLPDDVATLILNQSISDDTIRQFALALDDINASLGDEQALGILNILDAAIWSGRNDLARWLMKQGVSLQSDPFIGGPLDYALDRLHQLVGMTGSGGEPEDVIRQLAFIDYLIGLGQLATVAPTEDGYFVNNSGHSSYFFKPEGASSILERFGYNLFTVPKTIPPTKTANTTQLMDELSAQQQAYVSDSGYATANKIQAQCEDYLANVKQYWKPELIDVSESEETDKALFNRAPELVSCRRSYLNFKEKNEGRTSEFRAIMASAMNNDYSSVASALNTASEWLPLFTHRMLERWPKRYPELVNMGLISDDLNYLFFDDGITRGLTASTLHELHASGLDLHTLDRYGRSLFFTAIQAMNLEALTFLVEQNVPYYQPDNAPDPLYQALYFAATRGQEQNAYEIVSQLMSYQPTITQAHLNQMLLLKLRFRQTYDNIVDAFPALASDEESAVYPTETCRM